MCKSDWLSSQVSYIISRCAANLKYNYQGLEPVVRSLVLSIQYEPAQSLLLVNKIVQFLFSDLYY